MKKLICIVLMFFILKHYFTQNNFRSSIYKHHPYYLDSLLNKKVSDLGDSYYVIAFDIAMSHTTLDPQIIEELDKIKKIRACNEKVIFVIQNYDEIPDNIMKDYLTKSFNLTDEDWQFINYIIDNELTQKLICILPRVYYIFNHKLQHYNSIKRYNITDKQLPHHKFQIEELPDVILEVPDSIRIKADNIKLSPYKNNRILASLDPQSAIYSINIATGKFEKGIIAPNFSQTTNYYCQYIANGDTALCNYAKNCAKRSNIEKRKRQVFDFSCVYYVGDKIYAYADLQSFRPNLNESIVYDEEGKILKYKKGEPVLDLWYGIVCLDTNFQIQSFTLSKDKQYPPTESFCLYDLGFYYNNEDSSFIAVNGISEPTPTNFNVPLFSKYQKEKNEYEWKEDYPFKLTKKINHYMDVIPSNVFIKKWNNKIICTISPIGYIFDVKKGKIIDTLKGDGTLPYNKEMIPKYLEDTTALKLNYYVTCMNTILNDKFLVITYFYKGKLLCEIKNQNFQTIDFFDLSKMNGFEKFILSHHGYHKTTLCIHNDQIIFITIKNNQYIIKKFKISTCDFNSDK